MFNTNIEAIEHVFGGLEGKSLLDIGCGRGRLSRALAKRGAVMTGVDPQYKMVALAREAVPAGTFETTGGEALPFADNSFDGSVILNSLHHVPAELITPALSEAMRVVKPGGHFLVLEPLARGGYHEVFAPIDDETEVRAIALAMLEQFIAGNQVEVALRVEFDTMVPEENVESVLAGAIRVDPSRSSLVAEKSAEVSRLFDQHIRQTDRGPALDQPMIAVALRVPS